MFKWTRMLLKRDEWEVQKGGSSEFNKWVHKPTGSYCFSDTFEVGGFSKNGGSIDLSDFEFLLLEILKIFIKFGPLEKGENSRQVTIKGDLLLQFLVALSVIPIVVIFIWLLFYL